jgi:hypothetical protein
MAEKSAKKKRKNADRAGVLGSLPSTRPARMGRARQGPEDGGGPATATPVKPRAARKSSPPPVPESRRTRPPAPDGRRVTPPRGLEIVTTGAQAAGEIAKIGLTVGGQMLRRAARRLPRR